MLATNKCCDVTTTMSGALQGTTITVVYPIAIACRWQDENTVDRWITDNGGKHVANKFITETTHLVCGSDAWAAPAPAVKIALRAKDEFGHRVKIVTPEWLEDTLDVGPGDGLRRTSEGPFLCEKTEQADSVAAETPAQNAVVKANKRAHGGPRTRMRWMTEMLHESTEKFISEEVQRRIDIEVEARMQAALSAAKVDARKKTEEQDKQRRARRKRAAFLRRRGLKARNGTLSGESNNVGECSRMSGVLTPMCMNDRSSPRLYGRERLQIRSLAHKSRHLE